MNAGTGISFFKTALLFNIYFLTCCDGLPVVKDAGVDQSSMNHLQDWGYLANTSESELKSKHVVVDALKTFQKFANIESTGVLDEATKKMMSAPRCGMPDIVSAEEKERVRRYIRQGSKWLNRKVTWQLENTNDDGITVQQVRLIMASALKKWSERANIDFEEIPPTPEGPQPEGPPASQIRVRFDTWYHGDRNPFDGRGGTIAHAFYPLNNQGISGDIHFDDAEDFTIFDPPKRSGQTKLLWVAVHELGHSLGLSHSNVIGAIMYPYYNHFPGFDFNLTRDDVYGIQSIYGPRTTTPTTTTPTTTPPTTTPLTTTPPPTTTTKRTPTSTTPSTTPSSLAKRSSSSSVICSDFLFPMLMVWSVIFTLMK